MTSTAMLRIKPEEIDNQEKRGKHKIGVIGCQLLGVLHACLFAEAGYEVMCADTDQLIVNLLSKGKTPFVKQEIAAMIKTHIKNGRLSTTNDVKTTVSQSDIIIIATSAGLDERKKPSYSDLEKTCKLVGSNLQQGPVIIAVNTVGIGIMESILKEILENTSGLRAGADFGLAYSPVRSPHDQTPEMIADHERMVAATDKFSLNAASAILETVSKNGLRKIDNIKVAEAVQLFEATHHDVNLALANELALFCEKVHIDYFEAQKFAKPNTSGTIPLPTLVNAGIHEEPYMLLEESENLGARLRIPSLAREVNEGIVKHAVDLTKDALRNCGKTLRRARVSMLGISHLQNVKSSPKIVLPELAGALELKGARISIFDPYFSDNEVVEIQRFFKKSLVEAVEESDCILIITGHDQFKRLNLKKTKVMMKMPAAVIDFEGILEPDKVEKEGFVYRGLGRGVWTR